MGSRQNRYSDVIDKPLGPHWRIFRWQQVTVRKPYKSGRDYYDQKFLFKDDAKAVKFKAGVEKKYPLWKVYSCDVYVLSANNGKTAYELPACSRKPRATSNVGKLHKPDWVV